MAGDRPRYELHFHGPVQDAVVNNYNYDTLTQIFQGTLTQHTSLHQLPPDISDFTGRQEEQDKVMALLRQATLSREVGSAIAIMTGTAGVGKSSLAIHMAFQLKPDFPDAQLYVNLRGSEGQPLEPLDVLAGFLRALGLDEQTMPEDLTERSELYRSLLFGKRALLLLDNARDQAQVRPLLPNNSTCAVLITSRKRLADLEGAVIHDLTLLTEPEALELLSKLVGPELIQAQLEAAKTIIDLCSRLPLAIRITGGTLIKNQPQWQLDSYAHQLARERQRLLQLRLSDLEVRASLALSYQQLDAIAARLFRLLGLLTGSNFSPAVAAALWESDPATAEESVQCLVDLQLLEPALYQRYRFHDLVRLLARGQLAQEEPAEARQTARLRVSRWYLKTSEIMDLALNPETRRQLAQVLIKDKNQPLAAIERNLLLKALNWFEIERANLLASIDWAYQAKAWEIVVPLARNLVNFFNLYAYWSDWERTHLLALEASRALGDSLEDNSASGYKEAQLLTNLGNVHSLQSNWGKASECYKQSLGIFEELGDRPGVAKSLGNLGNVYSRQDYWGKASECYKQSLDTFGELRDRYGEAQTLANMGILYMQQSDKEKAVVLWQDALAKLPSDLPKTKRVAEWLQSIKGVSVEVPQKISDRPVERQKLIILGGFIVVIAIALFLLMLV